MIASDPAPVPSTISGPVPVRTPVNATADAGLLRKIDAPLVSALIGPAKVTAPAASSTPPPKARLDATPRFAVEPTRKRPPPSVSVPPNVLAPPSVSVPAPNFVSPADPPIVAVIAASWLTVIDGVDSVSTSAAVCDVIV